MKLYIKTRLSGRFLQQFFIYIFIIQISGCIAQFVPETHEDPDLLVVEGLLTDQPGQNAIKLSTSLPLGGRNSASPLLGCKVTVSDDQGNNYSFSELSDGNYKPDPSFHGIVGRLYTLHIKTGDSHNFMSYESGPVLMRPVPLIDSIYYEKRALALATDGLPTAEGVQIYLDTHDPENNCRFYRWEFIETWEFRIPYIVPNNTCWTTSSSSLINVRNTSSLSEDRVERQPVTFITNNTDRLKLKYSILVNQYSLSEDEYSYWEKLQNVVEQVGSLYDLIPASIPSNIKCIEKPEETVLGYFSVSAVKSKRMFITERFRGIVNLYSDCENQVVPYSSPIPDLNISVWLIIDHPFPRPGYKVLTFFKGCADCTVRGTTNKPDFWDDDNK